MSKGQTSNTRWVYLERTKAIVEILALIIGGLWALKLYVETDVPAQEKRASVQGDLKWTRKTAKDCLAEYTVTFKNVGKTSIDLSPPVLKGWIADAPDRNKPLVYLDPHQWEHPQADVEQQLTDREFDKHYPPDGSDSVTSVVMVQRNPGKVILFKLSFKQSGMSDPTWSDYHWDYACDGAIPEEPTQK